MTIGQHRVGCADPGDSVTYSHTVRNSSSSAQLVNITAFSALAWDVALYSDDGTTPLTDSDDDGRPDVGPLGPNESVEIVVLVSVPTYALSGTHDVVSVMVTGAQTEQSPQNWVQIRTAAGNGQEE